MLKYIAIDKAYIISSWRNFKTKYQILGHLKDVFSIVPKLILSTSITLNILDYIQVFLKLRPLKFIY